MRFTSFTLQMVNIGEQVCHTRLIIIDSLLLFTETISVYIIPTFILSAVYQCYMSKLMLMNFTDEYEKNQLMMPWRNNYSHAWSDRFNILLSPRILPFIFVKDLDKQIYYCYHKTFSYHNICALQWYDSIFVPTISALTCHSRG